MGKTIKLYHSKQLSKDFDSIAIYCLKQNFGEKIIRNAQEYYQVILKYETFKGPMKTSIMASCVYYSCILNKNPQHLNTISKIFGIDQNSANIGRLEFNKIIDIDFDIEYASF